MKRISYLEKLAAKRERELAGVNSYIKSVLDTLIDGVITIDNKGFIRTVNPAVTIIFGYTENELLGKNINILMPEPYHTEHDQYMQNYYQTGKSRILGIGRQVQGKRRNGEVFPLELSVTEINTPDNHYFTGLLRDVSERAEMEKQIKAAQERYERSQTYANIGSWDWNIQTGDLYWSERIAPLFGYKIEELETTYENFLNAVHPDDRQFVIDAVNNCVNDGAEYNIEHRCVWPDGTVRWLSEKGDVMRGTDGTPLHMLGVVQDITSRKYAEERLVLTNKILQQIAKGDATEYILDTVISCIEKMLNNVICSIWVLDGNNLFSRGKNRLPEDYLNTVNGAEVKEGAGSSATAICLNDHVLVSDIASDPVWEKYKGLAEKARFASSLSVPIPSHSDKPFGVIELFYPNPRTPDQYEIESINTVAKLVSVALYREQHELSLVKVTHKAIQANRAKSEFLSHMSHELRTPLNAILGFSQHLVQDDDLSEDQQDSVKEIYQAGKHLLELINDILDLARIESGGMKLKTENINLSSVIEQVISLTNTLAKNNNVEIILQPGCFADNFQVIGDFTKLKQVLLNLVSNAIKYNRPNGKVTISCDLRDHHNVQVDVTDTGKGIDEEAMSMLFEPFNRLGAELSNVEGSGIGLVITKQLVEAMDGKLQVSSEPGVGSTFSITLPGKKSQGTHQLQSSSDVKNKLHSKPQISDGKTIMYIEDNPANLKVIEKTLKKHTNLNLLSAVEPKLGLKLISEKKPDLILLDINLPGLSGHEIVKILKDDPETRQIPVLALSADVMEEDIRVAHDEGFDDYITKPINIPAFLKLLDKYLG